MSFAFVWRLVMFARRRKTQPHGTVAVLMCVSLFALVGFLALAIDLGMLAMTRAQLQDVSDAAAMAGCRALNGNTASGANNNYSAVAPTATAVATANTVMGGSLKSSNVSVNIGRWTYDVPSQTFQGQFPGPSGATGASCKPRSLATFPASWHSRESSTTPAATSR